MTVKDFISWVVLWSFSSFYSCLVLLLCLIKLLTSPRKFLYCKERRVRPKCLDDALFEHSYVRLQNLRMHYVSTGQEGKPLMLCLHGFPEFWYSWRNQLREFKDDYRVVAVDNRGYNETEAPTIIEEYTMDKICEDYKQLIDALGYKDCVLVGHDWGGVLAWRFAAIYPEYVKKLVIMNGPNEAMTEYLEKNTGQFFMSWYIFFFQMPYLPEFMMYRNNYGLFDSAFGPLVKKGAITEEDLEAIKYAFRNSVTGPINYYRANMWLKQTLPEDHRYGMPTLVLWSEKDAALKVELGQLSANKAVNCTFKVIPNASHCLQQECPEIVNKNMRDWLQDE